MFSLVKFTGHNMPNMTPIRMDIVSRTCLKNRGSSTVQSVQLHFKTARSAPKRSTFSHQTYLGNPRGLVNPPVFEKGHSSDTSAGSSSGKLALPKTKKGPEM